MRKSERKWNRCSPRCRRKYYTNFAFSVRFGGNANSWRTSPSSLHPIGVHNKKINIVIRTCREYPTDSKRFAPLAKTVANNSMQSTWCFRQGRGGCHTRRAPSVRTLRMFFVMEEKQTDKTTKINFAQSLPGRHILGMIQGKHTKFGDSRHPQCDEYYSTGNLFQKSVLTWGNCYRPRFVLAHEAHWVRLEAKSPLCRSANPTKKNWTTLWIFLITFSESRMWNTQIL